MTLMSMNNLAGAYRVAGRPSEALALAEESLKLQQVTLGREHPDTLKSMGNLAIVYGDAERSDEGKRASPPLAAWSARGISWV